MKRDASMAAAAANPVDWAGLTERMPEAFWVVDADSDRAVYANPAWEALWAKSRRDLETDGAAWLRAIHGEDAPRFRQALGCHRSGGLDEVLRLRRGDGSLRRVRIRSYPVEGSGPARVAFLALDDTEDLPCQATMEQPRGAECSAESLRKSILDALPLPVVIVDGDGVIADANRPWQEMFAARGGSPADYGVGWIYREFCASLPGLRPELLADLATGLEDVLRGRQDPFQMTFPNGDEAGRWTRILATPLKGLVFQGAVVMHSDVTESVRAAERIRHLIHFDEITGLPNRAQFLQQLAEAIARGRHDARPVTVAVLGLDRFRGVNQTLGYARGDRLLAGLGQRLREALKGRGLLARLGGDRFGLLLDGEDAQCSGRRLLDAVAQPLAVDGDEFRLAASIGVALWPRDGDAAETLLEGAEAAMYRAKEQGGNNLEFHNAELNARALAQRRLEEELHRALQEEEFVLYYQPKLDCRNGRIVGLEALLRWQHPQRGLLSPAEFVPLLELTGLVVPAGRWVIDEACRQSAAWLAEGVPHVPVAVNLSSRQLRAGAAFSDELRRIVESHGLPAGSLELELTESMLMDDAEGSVALLRSLREQGVHLSVDDFGTGYSSLAYLKRFPLDALKVDRAFVQDIAADPNDASITRAIITMAHALNLKVVAEGVETESQLGLLIANHCDEIQGYYFSQPLPADDVRELLRRDAQLPAHLLHLGERQRTLLLVDDEENILSAMKRLLRREGYQLLTAASGEQGLEVLAANQVDVIVSDQRMPGMTGIEFLSRAKELYPETVRIVLSGYTELQSVTGAINEGAIYKFLTKPWDDEQLKAHIAEAFRRKALSDENRDLADQVRVANRNLAAANERLETLLDQKQQRIQRDETALDVFQEMVQILPWPLVGVDDVGMVAALNAGAERLLSGTALGAAARESLPAPAVALLDGADGEARGIVGGSAYRILCRSLGHGSAGRGRVLLFVPEEEDHG